MTRTLAGRRFEAAVLHWDGTVAPERGVSTERSRRVLERLCGHGFDVGVVSGAQVDELDGRLAARPAGPGRLYLCSSRGSDVVGVGPDGPRLISRSPDAPAVRWLLEEFRRRGIGPHEVLVAGDDVGPERILELLDNQLARREQRELPCVAAEIGWTFALDGLDPEREPARAVLLTLADGLVGTTGCPVAVDSAGPPPHLFAAVYDGDGPETSLLECPAWNLLPGKLDGASRRVLDLRAGLVRQDLALAGGERLSAVLFSSLASPGTAVLRAEASADLLAGSAPLVVKEPATADVERRGRITLARSGGSAAGVAVAAAEECFSGELRDRLDRVAVYRPGRVGPPQGNCALPDLVEAERDGFERLLVEHRCAWARRWENADVDIEGDPELQLSVRFALFHLMASVAESGEAAVGARGLSGRAYRGHVFWDADVFVLPFLAATHPEAARAMLEYRLRRLPAARAAARRRGRAGACFPWESAALGEDVTPPLVHDRTGQAIAIRNGLREEHITADVAWAAACYVDWTGDEEFASGPGRELLVETARYWASRIRRDSHGRGHIYGVIGPDEYHEPVDDNAFTNVMARWNLRRAAGLTARLPGDVTAEERESWLHAAVSLVDGYDPDTELYEQFAGFWKLAPLVVDGVLQGRPMPADVLIGRRQVRRAQVLKQTDVLMLHHLVPDEVAPGSLEPNLRFYEPRTAHGSSLSPGIHAALFARAGMLEHAVEMLRTASRIDLDDLTGSTAGGLHLATMGSVWQALAFGFAGLQPTAAALEIDPKLPAGWQALELRLRFRGSRVCVRIERAALIVNADPAALVRPVGVRTPVAAGPAGVRFERRGESWTLVQPGLPIRPEERSP